MQGFVSRDLRVVKVSSAMSACKGGLLSPPSPQKPQGVSKTKACKSTPRSIPALGVSPAAATATPDARLAFDFDHWRDSLSPVKQRDTEPAARYHPKVLKNHPSTVCLYLDCLPSTFHGVG